MVTSETSQELCLHICLSVPNMSTVFITDALINAGPQNLNILLLIKSTQPQWLFASGNCLAHGVDKNLHDSEIFWIIKKSLEDCVTLRLRTHFSWDPTLRHCPTFRRNIVPSSSIVYRFRSLKKCTVYSLEISEADYTVKRRHRLTFQKKRC